MFIYIYFFFGVSVDMYICKKTVSWKKENRTRNVFDHKMLEGLTKASCDEPFLRNFFGPRMCVWLARERRFWEIMGQWKIRRVVFGPVNYCNKGPGSKLLAWKMSETTKNIWWFSMNSNISIYLSMLFFVDIIYCNILFIFDQGDLTNPLNQLINHITVYKVFQCDCELFPWWRYYQWITLR